MSDSWTFSESRPIPPYRMSATALSEVGFRSNGELVFNDAEPFHLVLEAKDIRAARFSPELSLAVNKPQLASDTGIDQDDLVLSILIADPGMLKAAKVAQWPLASAPATYKIPKEILDTVSAVRGINLRVCASPRKALKPSAGRATAAGQVVASKDFTIDVPSDAAGFPIETHPSEVFVQHHYPADTVWVIRWKTGSDFDRPIEECLAVWFNSDHAVRLMRLAPGDRLGNVLWNEIAIEICLEIALVVLASAPAAPANQSGLLAKVVGKLQSEPPMSIADLSRKARLDRDGVGFFRSRLQAAFGQGKKILAIPLAGRS